jgi:LmbE family N-acetylglucosaminyl deacetylase
MYKVLCISCHPDDMEISCSGTLLKCKKRGDEVTVCHVANGNMGHVVIPADELREMRINEAKESSAIAGFKVMTCDIGDLMVNSADRAQHDKIVEVIRSADPDFIITHAPDDYMIDHVEVSKLVFFASFSASVPHYRPELGPASKVTPIYYMENASMVNCEPDIFVDITDEIETKLEMLSCHKSQLVWLKEHDGVDILAKTRTQSAFRGVQCDVSYAEGFRLCRAALRMAPKRYLP